MSDDILFEITEKVGVITLNRPQKKNAMNADILAGLMEMLDRIKNDPEIRAGIITGSGSTFSAGADLKARAQEGGGRAQDKSPAAIVATDFSMNWRGKLCKNMWSPGVRFLGHARNTKRILGCLRELCS